jgi:diadenosine tetraphosphate (Ap4A) HIT family hydrolase
MTIFEKIVRRDSGEDRLEDEEVIAFTTSTAQAPVHVLVVPKAPSRGW